MNPDAGRISTDTLLLLEKQRRLMALQLPLLQARAKRNRRKAMLYGALAAVVVAAALFAMVRP
jgi:hypothetical protein